MPLSIVVIGAGPAGLTAAHRLRQRGCAVTVLEREPHPGGRTHTEHHGDGHWVDTGAGWLASFYPDTLALLDELGLRHLLTPMQLRGGGDLLLDGRVVPTPNSIRRIATTRLLSPVDKGRLFAYMAALLVRQKSDLRVDLDYDTVPAIDELRRMGEHGRDRVVRPNFEGPFFARLEEMSAALVRSWLRCLSTGTFFHVEGGMDAPWRRLADSLDVRTGVAVERVAIGGDHVVVDHGGGPSGTTGRSSPSRRRWRQPSSSTSTVRGGSPTSRTHRTCASMPPAAAGGSPAAASTCSPTRSSPPSRSGEERSGRGGRCPPIGSGRSCALRRRRAHRCSTSRPTA